MRSLANIQSLRSVGVGGVLNSGLTVQWTAAASTVAAPTTIWSENTGDANNQILVQYNGVVVSILKRIAGVNTYVAVPFTATNGVVYPVKIQLLADNTMQLTVNGVAASAGLGAELLTNGSFTGNATGWTLQTGWAYGTNNAVATNAAQYAAGFQAVGTLGKPTQISFDITARSSGSLVGRFGGVSGYSKNSTGAYLASAIVSGGTGVGFNTDSVAVTNATVDNVSAKLINNNTDTTAIPWATVL